MISSGLGHEALVSHSPVSGPLLPDPDPPGFSFGKYLILLPGCGVDIFVFEFETEELEFFEKIIYPEGHENRPEFKILKVSLKL